MSKSATKGEFSFCSRWNAARQKSRRSSVGAGYMWAGTPKSNPKKQIFSGTVDGYACAIPACFSVGPDSPPTTITCVQGSNLHKAEARPQPEDGRRTP